MMRLVSIGALLCGANAQPNPEGKVVLTQYAAVKNEVADILTGPNNGAMMAALQKEALMDSDFDISMTVTSMETVLRRSLQGSGTAPFCVLCGNCEGCVQAEGALAGYEPDPTSYAHYYQEGSRPLAFEYSIDCGAAGQTYVGVARADCDTVSARVGRLQSSPILAQAHAEALVHAINAAATAGGFSYNVVVSTGVEIANTITNPSTVLVTIPNTAGETWTGVPPPPPPPVAVNVAPPAVTPGEGGPPPPAPAFISLGR